MKQRLCLIIFLLATAIFANDRAVSHVSHMLHSLDHIQTIQCDVTHIAIESGKRTTQNYHLVANRQYAAATFNSPRRVAYIKNKKGSFVVNKGEAQRQPKGQAFPVDMPHLFLANLNINDISENYQFLINSETPTSMIVNIIPIDIDRKNKDDDQVTLLKLTIGTSDYLLNRVDIFKNNSLKSNDFVKFEYVLLESSGGKRGVLKRSYSYAKRNKLIYINDNRYENIRINQALAADVFDE